ncbi:hypothetical protein [Kineococcus sp. SYSU DK004]|uniref:hypothetical protein n=1 Tax=Kineococcus sp. SYSU DK004 TaxID=3383125 RepID=UPI003D7E667A
MHVPVVVPLVLLALAVCAVGALARPRWDGGLLLGLLAAVWTRVNGPVEGRVLHTWSPGRGFTEADLLAVAALVLAAVTLLRCLLRVLRPARAGSRPRPAGAAARRAAAGHQGP